MKELKYRFNEYAGYDCMSGGYEIYDEEDNTICIIECNGHTEEIDKEDIAKLIVNSVNKQLQKEIKEERG